MRVGGEAGPAGRATRVEEADGHVVVTLDRPAVRNAIDAGMVAELHLVVDDLERRPRVLVLTGGPDIFAAGADLHDLRARGPAEALAGINRTLFDRIAALPMPSIAAVGGAAVGGAAELAYACDIRIGTPATRFAHPEVRLGLLPASGACWRLPALVGPSRAKAVLLGGHEIGAEEALATGLLAAVVEPECLLDEACAWAERIVGAAPLAVQLTKAAVDAGPGAHPHLDDVAQAVLFGSGEKDRRIDAALAGRTRR